MSLRKVLPFHRIYYDFHILVAVRRKLLLKDSRLAPEDRLSSLEDRPIVEVVKTPKGCSGSHSVILHYRMHTLVGEDLPQVHYLAGVELRKQVLLAIEVESRAHSDLLVIKMQPDQLL